MPSTIEIVWKNRVVGHVHSPWDACEAVPFANEADISAFADAPGEFIAEPGVEAGADWYRSLRIDGRFVDGRDLAIGDVEQLEQV